MSRNQIVRTQLSHRPSDSVNAKGHPTFTPGAPHLHPWGTPPLPWGTPPSSLGHPTFIPGPPHLHPWGIPPQAPVSASTRGPSRTFQSQANQPLPCPHAPGPADATMSTSLDSLLSPLTWSGQELGHSLQALSASGSQACPPASLRDPSSLHPARLSLSPTIPAPISLPA